MLVSDYLRPAAVKAGVLRVTEDGMVYDTSGSPVHRFGFHNLRHSLSTALITGEKQDPRTVQDMMRHSNSSTTLDLYTQEDSDEARGAQGAFLKALGMHSEVVQ